MPHHVLRIPDPPRDAATIDAAIDAAGIPRTIEPTDPDTGEPTGDPQPNPQIDALHTAAEDLTPGGTGRLLTMIRNVIGAPRVYRPIEHADRWTHVQTRPLPNPVAATLLAVVEVHPESDGTLDAAQRIVRAMQPTMGGDA